MLFRSTTYCLDRLDEQIIHASKQLQHPANQDVYDYCLRCQLTFDLRECLLVKADTSYLFEARTERETIPVSVSFLSEQLSVCPSVPKAWLDKVYDKSPLSFSLEDLSEDAAFLDEREGVLTKRFGWRNTDKGDWVGRFRKISFHKIQTDGTLGGRNTAQLKLDGFTHLAGMVAAGKTTLSTLLATRLIRQASEGRLTIVVGDVQSAIRLANQLNWWFCDDPENDAPVAIPLLGRSKRDAHLKAFYASKDYQDHLQREQPHWSERWLGTACPLQALLEPSTIRDELEGRPLTPGTEPCHSLREKFPPRDQPKRFHLCPFFAKCPSQQAYLDMPSARIWITTAGGMAMGGAPRHLELRRIKLGELVYEHSSIVIFDEVDTIIKWFDDVYAESVTLTNGKDGVFDTINIMTEKYTTFNRVRPPLTVKWTTAERHAQIAITATLILLNQKVGQKILREWTQRGYFTPNALFYKLARRIAGLEEFDPPGLSEAQQAANKTSVQKVVCHFNELLDRQNPLQGRLSSDPQKNPVDGLMSLMQNINTTGESATSFAIHRACKGWISRFFPKTKQQLETLKAEVSKRPAPSDRKGKKQNVENEVDTLDTLAYRLQFCLTVTLLDLHTRNVFYQWHHRPYEIDDEPPHRRMPIGM